MQVNRKLFLVISASLIGFGFGLGLRGHLNEIKYSIRFLRDLNALGRACLTFRSELDDDPSRYSPEELLNQLEGGNPRGVIFLSKQERSTITLVNGELKGPNMENIDMVFRERSVSLFVYKNKKEINEGMKKFDGRIFTTTQ